MQSQGISVFFRSLLQYCEELLREGRETFKGLMLTVTTSFKVIVTRQHRVKPCFLDENECGVAGNGSANARPRENHPVPLVRRAKPSTLDIQTLPSSVFRTVESGLFSIGNHRSRTAETDQSATTSTRVRTVQGSFAAVTHSPTEDPSPVS